MAREKGERGLVREASSRFSHIFSLAVFRGTLRPTDPTASLQTNRSGHLFVSTIILRIYRYITMRVPS